MGLLSIKTGHRTEALSVSVTGTIRGLSAMRDSNHLPTKCFLKISGSSVAARKTRMQGTENVNSRENCRYGPAVFYFDRSFITTCVKNTLIWMLITNRFLCLLFLNGYRKCVPSCQENFYTFGQSDFGCRRRRHPADSGAVVKKPAEAEKRPAAGQLRIFLFSF